MIGSSNRVYWSCHSSVPGLLFSSTIRLSFLSAPATRGSVPFAADSVARPTVAKPAVAFTKLLRPIGLDQIPAYLKAVTLLEPEGNVAAGVAMRSTALLSRDGARY